MISLQGVTRRFGSFTALDGVDLEVPAGTVQGLLGPNGAGKTTTVRVLTTLLGPDDGDALVAGYSVRHRPDLVRAHLGVSGQYAAVDDKLTGPENLQMVGELYGMRRAEARRRAGELLEQFRLDGVPASQRAGSYSGGMRRRLDLAGAIVARPPVVILDEPTTGLDPRGRRDTWDAITSLARDGTTVLLTTQYLEEADELADSIAVIDGGRIVAEGTSASLKTLAGGARIDLVAVAGQESAVLELLAPLELGAVSAGRSGRITASAPEAGRSLARVLEVLDAAGVSVAEAALRQPTLDEVFLRITRNPSGSRRKDDPVNEPLGKHAAEQAAEQADEQAAEHREVPA
ncbi:ATP-binding cassette domain-containing protein [Cellulosimicrobium funkei]|nr:ATP-binding cassette domain-containing protein [Cellulosimicrobium funkei]